MNILESILNVDFSSMGVFEWVTFVIGILYFIVSLIVMIITYAKKKKQNKDLELAEMLKTELIPLMEEAEQFINYSGEEKEQWVIKKLADKLHIDLFKYKNVLEMIKNIISEICKTTKISVNNIVVKQEIKDTKTNEPKNII